MTRRVFMLRRYLILYDLWAAIFFSTMQKTPIQSGSYLWSTEVGRGIGKQDYISKTMVLNPIRPSGPVTPHTILKYYYL
jgi:hypothetical protein